MRRCGCAGAGVSRNNQQAVITALAADEGTTPHSALGDLLACLYWGEGPGLWTQDGAAGGGEDGEDGDDGDCWLVCGAEAGCVVTVLRMLAPELD